MVGKILLALLVAVQLVAQNATIRLKVTDEEGVELKQVAVGVPFLLEVDAQGLQSRGKAAPRIRGLDALHAERYGVRMSSVNGVTSIRHQYRLIADNAGTYRIGPAEIDDAGTVVRSSVLVITAAADAVVDARAQAARHKKEASRTVLLQIHTDKDSVVIGERLRCFVRFLFRTNNISLQTIQVPEFVGFTELGRSGPTPGKEVVDGVMYDYLEWECTLMAKEAGLKKIPGFAAEFVTHNDDDVFAGLNRLLRGFADKKRIHSSPLALRIDNLPPHNPPVQLVGHVDDVRVFIDNPAVREGEAMVYTVELTGDGNMATVDTLTSMQFPDAFKAYPSKSYIVDGPKNGPTQKKRFEYILQAVKKGSWEIPAQKIYYFDVASRTYQQREAPAQSVTVLATLAPKKNSAVSNAQNVVQLSTPVVLVSDELAPLCKDYTCRVPYAWRINWWLFICAVLLPLGAVGAHVTWSSLPSVVAWCMPHRQKKKFWAQARRRMDAAKNAHDYAALYALVVESSALYCGVPQEQWSSQTMVQLFEQRGVASNVCSRWQNFFDALSGLKFAQHSSSLQQSNDIFDETAYWLNILESSGQEKMT